MSEERVIQILTEEGIDLAASLPCDKNKRLTALLHESFKTVDLTREEDGVGICAGAYLAGKKPVLSIQSSGLGNMLNAMMSLTCVYKMPLPILASWRGGADETIEAQIPFNQNLPRLLDVYGIPYRIFSEKSDLGNLREIIQTAYDKKTPAVALILPSCWETPMPPSIEFPPRKSPPKTLQSKGFEKTPLVRNEAISAIAGNIPADAVLISNIGIPSKELYASKDRALNFYMLGSYTQASAIGLGCALGMKREVYVIDGDGSLLGSSVLPVIAAENPANLTIFALDNGTFGSTGNQITPAYSTADLAAIAAGSGVQNVTVITEKNEFTDIFSQKKESALFVHVPIRPGNSNVPNIPIPAEEIKKRFMTALSDPG
ncbi:MAG: sulfopyruvate decarboxylase subunit beta [Methanosarcinales archaeon]|nr:sulfopyruvate decarboxylase subunit beta [Methanosarcinales archaeon]